MLHETFTIRLFKFFLYILHRILQICHTDYRVPGTAARSTPDWTWELGIFVQMS